MVSIAFFAQSCIVYCPSCNQTSILRRSICALGVWRGPSLAGSVINLWIPSKKSTNNRMPHAWSLRSIFTLIHAFMGQACGTGSEIRGDVLSATNQRISKYLRSAVPWLKIIYSPLAHCMAEEEKLLWFAFCTVSVYIFLALWWGTGRIHLPATYVRLLALNS